jgi:hypothetical protein
LAREFAADRRGVNIDIGPAGESYMYKGSCLCGAVKYEIRGTLGPIVFCHCSQCRKAQGSAFAANAAVKTREFEVVAGKDALVEYRSSPGKKRVFCGICGSPIFSARDNLPDFVRLRIGTLDTEVQEQPSAHIHVASKATWFEINDSLPQYAELEPGRPIK